ncbi:hypothetical protein QUA41_08365 [Microcoleus sp. Pol11C1]|uniref:hypothetical protein n=1 Tax=Microcoleus sp. POL1_C1 TaxID=2818870 RepID=UPI002FD0D2B9
MYLLTTYAYSKNPVTAPKVMAKIPYFPGCSPLASLVLIFGEVCGWERQSCADFYLYPVNFDLDF